MNERIDTHCHLFSPELGARINDETPFKVHFSLDAREMSTALGLVLPLRPEAEQAERIGELGITRQIMSVRTSALIDRFSLDSTLADRAVLARSVNDHLLALATSYPECFSAYADIPLSAADAGPAIAELERIHATGRFAGILLTTNYTGDYLDNPGFEPFFAKVAELGVDIFLHPTLPFGVDPLLDHHLYAIVGFPADTTLTIARMIYSGFFDRYPDLTIIASHAGGNIPFLWWRMGLGYRENWNDCRSRLLKEPQEYLSNLYYDTALTDTSMLMHTHERVPGRIVLGTDYPYEARGTQRVIDAILAMDVADEVKADILGGTLRQALKNIK